MAEKKWCPSTTNITEDTKHRAKISKTGDVDPDYAYTITLDGFSMGDFPTKEKAKKYLKSSKWSVKKLMDGRCQRYVKTPRGDVVDYGEGFDKDMWKDRRKRGM